MKIILWKVFLYFPRVRTVDFSVQARRPSLRCDNERQRSLKGLIRETVDVAIVSVVDIAGTDRKIFQCFPDSNAFFSKNPCLVVNHLPANGSKNVDGAEVVPYSIGTEDQNITV